MESVKRISMGIKFIWNGITMGFVLNVYGNLNEGSVCLIPS